MFRHAQTETQKDENSGRQTGMRKGGEGGGGGGRASEQVDKKQCSGSASGSGIHIFLGFSGPHLDALVTSMDTDEDPAPSLFS